MATKAIVTGVVVSDKMNNTVKVAITETRPLSARKRWVVTSIVEKAKEI
jgi:ribosomal protein S17